MIRRKRLTAEAREQYRDRRGIAYADRHLLVPARVSDWPKYPKRVKHDKEKLQMAFHRDFVRTPCWICGNRGNRFNDIFALHHLAAGSRGRSHERELFTYLCETCHKNVSPDDLGKLLWAKWQYDHEWCDWEFLTVRHGFHLPELEVPEWAS